MGANARGYIDQARQVFSQAASAKDHDRIVELLSKAEKPKLHSARLERGNISNDLIVFREPRK